MTSFDKLFDVVRLHGNGFLQMDVCPNWRLHIFHPELIKFGQKTRTPIHDHVFDMTSNVLYGELKHIHYGMFEPKDYKFGEYDIFSVLYDGNKTVESTLSRHSVDPVCFKVLAEYNMKAGSSYRFKAGEWHESLSEGLTITLIHKSEAKTNMARVACLIGSSPDNDFKRNSIPKHITEKYRNILEDKIKIETITKIIMSKYVGDIKEDLRAQASLDL